MKLKSNEVKLRFPNIGQVEKAQLVSFSDASLANLKNGGSKGGGIIFIVGEIKAVTSCSTHKIDQQETDG